MLPVTPDSVVYVLGPGFQKENPGLKVWQQRQPVRKAQARTPCPDDDQIVGLVIQRRRP